LAETARGQVKAGADPWGVRQAKLLESRQAERAARERSAADAFTFGRMVETWHAKALVHRRPRYAADARNRMLAYFTPWHRRPADSIARAEVVAMLDRLESERGTISARRALAYARACYGWTIKRNLLTENPFRGIAAPGKENPRDRVLTDAELGAVWRAAETLTVFYRAFVRMLILTAQRREEVAGMRWAELSPDLGSWTIPAERAKNGRAHIVHLSEAARLILTTQPRIEGTAFVFPGPEDRHISGFSRAKKLLDARLAAERRAPGIDRPWCRNGASTTFVGPR
jgi:integrase